MDNRSFEAGAAAAAPALPAVPSNGYPTAGNPALGVPATYPGPYWFHQLGEELRAVIVAAGLVPDAANLSQLAAAISGIIGVGSVAFFARSTAPTGWLKCNGAAVSRSAYAALFAAIGTAFGAGDGATTFNLPDFRGEFLRGWDDGRGVDAARAFGSAQTAEAGSLTMNTTTSGVATGAATVLDTITINGVTFNDATNSQVINVSPGDSRPRNMALLACIKY